MFDEYIELSQKTLDIYTGHDSREDDDGDEIRFDEFIKLLKNNDLTSSKKLYKSESQLVRKYLEHFCWENNGSLDDFQKDFSKWFIAEIERKVKVFQSKDGFTSLSEIVSIDEYKEIADRVIIEFTEQNKDYFSIEEDVSLQVSVKNVQRLDVKIFEFNTLTYYKKNLK